LPNQSAYASFSGGLSQPSTVYLSAPSGRWQLDVDGHSVHSSRVLGWANAFDAPVGASASLRFDTPPARRLWLGGQILLWVLLLGMMFRARVRAQSARDLEVIEAEGELA
ncbi:MAG TPA: hypothetical protein VMT43_04885, partial [Acidimicrobiales bacterium]|nr:hypothetical protein [Acidimicrobiales bacterium]